MGRSCSLEIFSQGLGYFRSTAKRHGGKINVVRYYKIRNDGMIHTIDVERKTTKVNMSFGSRPFMIEKSTKKAFDKAVNQVINN